MTLGAKLFSLRHHEHTPRSSQPRSSRRRPWPFKSGVVSATPGTGAVFQWPRTEQPQLGAAEQGAMRIPEVNFHGDMIRDMADLAAAKRCSRLFQRLAASHPLEKMFTNKNVLKLCASGRVKHKTKQAGQG